jgi:ribonuclease HII
LLVDGRDKFWFDYPHSSIIDGDELEPCIAAASIVAKVTRDRIMLKHDKIFPQFEFKSNKGYGTPEHFDLVKARGLSVIHRKSFIHD